MHSYRWFNAIFLCLAAILSVANIWLWRGYLLKATGSALIETHLTFRELLFNEIEPLELAVRGGETRVAETLIIVSSSVSRVSGEDKVEAEKILEKVTVQKKITATSSLVTGASVSPLPTLSQSSASADSLLTGKLALGPEDVNLKVPFTSQAPEKNWEQPWQDACEEAALLMLDAYYKGYGLSPLFARDELLKMIAWEEERGWEGSIEMEKIRQIAVEYLQLRGEIKIIEEPTVDQIKNYVARGQPVLLVAYGKVLPNRFYSRGGPEYHALIIRGYTADQFITNDPGVNRGENFSFKIVDVMAAIHDWNEGDVPTGRRVALIME